MQILGKLKEIAIYFNEKGVPIPLARDPKSNRGDVAFTNLLISIGIITILLLSPLFGIKKDTLDMLSALGYLGISAGLYWERKKALEKLLDSDVKKE